MAMPLEKAKKVLKAYKDHNYNAKDALTSVGYSRLTASKMPARTIDTAVNTIVASGDHNAIYEFVGMNRADISREYQKVITQDKNYPAKLRALEPLLKQEGIKWDDQKTTVNPTLNLIVKETQKSDTSLSRGGDSTMSHNISLAPASSPLNQATIEDTAELSHRTGAGVDFPPLTLKEEESRSQNFDEKVTIDKNEEELPNNEKEEEPQI